MCIRDSHVPTLVKLPFVLGDPFFGYMMWRVCGPGREIHKEGLVRRKRLLSAHPTDRFVSHVCHEVVVRVLWQFDRRHPVVQKRRPLICLASHKAVELVETRASGPAVGRPGGTNLPGRGFVVLAKLCGAVTVQTDHLRQICNAVWTLTRLSGEGRGCLCD